MLFAGLYAAPSVINGCQLRGGSLLVQLIAAWVFSVRSRRLSMPMNEVFYGPTLNYMICVGGSGAFFMAFYPLRIVRGYPRRVSSRQRSLIGHALCHSGVYVRGHGPLSIIRLSIYKGVIGVQRPIFHGVGQRSMALNGRASTVMGYLQYRQPTNSYLYYTQYAIRVLQISVHSATSRMAIMGVLSRRVG